LLGLVLIYSLERLVKVSKNRTNNKELNEINLAIFWLHIGAFTIYNAIIGYLLVRAPFENYLGILFYFLALSVHLVTNDWSLRRDHMETYDRYGRYLLTFAPIIGWIIGVTTEVNEFALSVLQAFIAGGVVLNALKDELPEEQESSLSSFLLGVIGYTLLLLLI
jgi:zinc transporter ZupT